MKQTWLFFIFVVALGSAQDISCRMRSLGGDFALLVPDEETDVWFSAVFLESPVVGVHFNQCEVPVSLRACTRRVGIAGMYWPRYTISLDSATTKRFSVEDRLRLAMVWRPGRAGISLSPDVSRSLWKRSNSTGYIEHDRNQSFMLRGSFGLKASSTLYMVAEPSYGLWESYHKLFDYELPHRDVHIPTGRISFLHRRSNSENEFRSALLRIGGPTSIAEVRSLGFDPFINTHEKEKVVRPFGNAVLVALGLARGLPIDDRSVFVLGIRTDTRLAYANTGGRFGPVDSIKTDLLGRAVLPIATEYAINRVRIRFGAHLSYQFSGFWKETEFADLRRTLHSWMNHAFDYRYSCGLGWRPDPRLALDMYCHNLADVRYWVCQVSYLF